LQVYVFNGTELVEEFPDCGLAELVLGYLLYNYTGDAAILI